MRLASREQNRHIKLLHIKLLPLAPVTDPPGRVFGQKDLCSLGSEDSAQKTLTPGLPVGKPTPRSPQGSPAKKVYVYVPFSYLSLKALVLLGDAPELFRNSFAAVRAMSLLCESCSAPPRGPGEGILMPRGKHCRETIFAARLPRNYLAAAKIPFTLPMAKTKTMVLVFGFSFPLSVGFQGKSGFSFGKMWF